MRVINALREFLALESSGGILLAIAAAAALACANSPLADLYQRFLDTPVEVRVGALDIAKPLLLWVNDGLMAVFFFLVGLELKREALQGELADPKQVLLPALAAAAGMAVPAAIYLVLNRADAAALRGWAIPTATDIAFALGVLALLGERVPNGLKVFLLTLAILDDLGAIVIIAAFYTSELSGSSLAVAGAALAVLFALNRFKVWRIAPYMMVGLVLWVSVLKSGVHATLAGVALAMFIPLRAHDAHGTHSPLRRLENDLHPAVAYVILPLFAFANAGVPLAGLSPAAFVAPVPLGIGAGLLVGKTLGVLGATWIAVRLGWARLPGDVGWGAMTGTALLCGIGFTMSLFIAGLAFESAAAHFAVETRLGILGGSLVAALAGYALLYAVLPRRAQAQA